MLKITAGIRIETLTTPIPGKLEHAHCSTVVTSQGGEILVAYYHAIKEAHPTQGIYGVRNPAGQELWSPPFLISNDIKRLQMEGNPVLWVAPDTEKLWLFYTTSWTGWSTCVLRSKTSDDRGETWSKSKKVWKKHWAQVRQDI